jgi:hypothetical protein
VRAWGPLMVEGAVLVTSRVQRCLIVAGAVLLAVESAAAAAVSAA